MLVHVVVSVFRGVVEDVKVFSLESDAEAFAQRWRKEVFGYETPDGEDILHKAGEGTEILIFGENAV